MVTEIHSYYKKLIDHSQTEKDYLEFLRYAHLLLFEELGLDNTLFIFRFGDQFVKSTCQHSEQINWTVRTNDVYDLDKFLKLAEIAHKEADFISNKDLEIEIFSADERCGSIWIRSSQVKDNSIEVLNEIKDLLYLIVNSLYRQFQLKERVKELTCLHSLSKLSENKGLTISQFLAETVKLIPLAWQYPQHTQVRIIYNGESYSTENFKKSKYKLLSSIFVNDLEAGSIEVNYPEDCCDPEIYPFLKDEEVLIKTISGELNMILEKKKAEGESRRLEKQLLHADRLVTLGQLSAGIAHEINEPLAGILGLAQLMEKNESLDDQAHSDLENIVSASLHAREVVKKLMLFARQMPAAQSQINLNDSVKNAVFFLESRCSKNMITITQKLVEDIPVIVADPSQMHQVLINLIVNALHAMPDGGYIRISTSYDDQKVYLICKDSGIGMNKKTMSQIFDPFFTTKKVNEGTGLGLSVVHGIVYSHHGDIKVSSKPGDGATFRISFPRLNKVG